MNNTQKLNFLTLFGGLGGSDLGVLLSGYFKPALIALENDPNAAKTYMKNFPDTPVWLKHIDNKLTGQQILEQITKFHPHLNIKAGEINLVIASPPCKEFSMSGSRLIKDIENELYKVTVRLIGELYSETFIIENVKGVMTGKMKEYFFNQLIQLRLMGYTIKVFCLNSAHYGVPQERERVFVVGVRNDIASLGFIPSLPLKTNPTGKGLRICDQFHNIEAINPGQFRRGWFTSDQICPTITATQSIKIKDGSGIRKMTVDELKIFFSFPPKFIVDGHYTYRCLGNCVPPLMMKAVSKMVAEEILKPYKEKSGTTREAA